MVRYTEEQINEVAEALSTERNIAAHKRLQILLWRMQRKSEKEIEAFSGVDRVTIWRICNGYRKEGLESVYSKNKGNNRKIPATEEVRILSLLNITATNGDFVRVSELKAGFEALAGVEYEYSAFYTLLSRNDWRKVVPRGRHPKAADEAACEAVKKLT